ncbi:MAG: phosphatase PAP2 family protein [Ignavibacteriaceae bacterium]|nr:phosphatase PAP2 family protein [Ignavibacteriaceae bacterium]
MTNNLIIKIFYLLICLTLPANAQQNISTRPGLYPFGNFGNNILNSFKGNNLYFHLAGAASTAILVSSNADYYVQRYFNEHEEFGNATIPIIRIATYFPFVIGGSLFAYGKLKKDDEAVGASYAVIQSSIIAFSYNSLLKAITGRPNPDWRHTEDMSDLSKTFRFGFLRGGVYWGWPSGHTSSTMAVVAALTSFYPDKTWLKVVGYSYVAYMVLGVSSVNRGGMHWFSDAIAATLMSYAIGSTVGKYYRSTFGLKNANINYYNISIGL